MTTTLDTWMQDETFRREYVKEGFVLECLESICEFMQQQNISAAELARRLGESHGYVTRVMRGQNVSLRTLAAIVHALGGKPHFSITVEPT